MPDSSATNLAQALSSAATTVASGWQAIPGGVWIGLYAVWVVGSVLFVVMQRRRPTATLAWIVGFIGMPLLGAPIYFFFGPRKLRRRKVRRELAKRFASRIAPAYREQQPTTLASRHWLGSLARLATIYGDAPPKQTRAVTLFMEGDSTYAAIESAMRNAREQIHLEYYIFEPDAVGTRWRDLLAQKAREGVAVRLLVDALGSKNCKTRFWRPLIEAGGQVRLFNPPRWLKLRASLLNFRTHRKIVVIDGAIAFTGGINVSEGYSETSSMETSSLEVSSAETASAQTATPLAGGMPGRRPCGSVNAWRDTHMAIEGAAALDLQLIFLEDWLYAGTGNSEHQSMDKLLMDTPEDIARWFPQPSPLTTPVHGPWVQIIASGPDEPIASIHRFLFTAFSSARRRIWITTPYFVPDEPIMTALVTARARGVDVQIIVPRLGDSRFVTAAASTFAEEVVREDVTVWEYTPRMIHAKTIVIDDELSIVGTANIDNRSFRLNFEVIAAIYDAGINAELTAAFHRDLAGAVKLQADDARQPFMERLVKSAARLAAPLL
jgi:cardiolipin synthase